MQNLRVDNVQPLDLKSPVFVELHIRFLIHRRGKGYLYVSMNRHQTQLYLSIVDFPIETIQNLYLKSCFRSSKRFIQNATLPPPDLLWLKMTFLDQNIFKSNSETAIHFMGKRFEWKHFEQRNTNILHHTQKQIEYFNADSRRSLKGKLINYLLLIFKFDLYVNPFLFRETASAKSL